MPRRFTLNKGFKRYNLPQTRQQFKGRRTLVRTPRGLTKWSKRITYRREK